MTSKQDLSNGGYKFNLHVRVRNFIRYQGRCLLHPHLITLLVVIHIPNDYFSFHILSDLGYVLSQTYLVLI